MKLFLTDRSIEQKKQNVNMKIGFLQNILFIRDLKKKKSFVKLLASTSLKTKLLGIFYIPEDSIEYMNMEKTCS